MLGSFNLLMISLVSHCHGTAFPEGKQGGVCKGQAGAVMGSVGAALG